MNRAISHTWFGLGDIIKRAQVRIVQKVAKAAAGEAEMPSLKILFTCAAALCLHAAAGVAPAMAQNNACSAWTFALEQEEVGKVWSASVCAAEKSAKDTGDTHLSLSCIGSSINLRYMPVVEGDFENQKLNFVFSNGASQVALLLAYEAMDGAFAGNVAVRGKLAALLRKGAELTVSNLEGKVPEKRFTLKGSGKSLAALAAKCK